jgi:hypothetical protein
VWTGSIPHLLFHKHIKTVVKVIDVERNLVSMIKRYDTANSEMSFDEYTIWLSDYLRNKRHTKPTISSLLAEIISRDAIISKLLDEEKLLLHVDYDYDLMRMEYNYGRTYMKMLLKYLAWKRR